MEFRRSGQRDERRRRGLIEDARNERPTEVSETPDCVSKGSAISATTYSEGARADQQPRITDLIPTRVWTLLVLGLLGASAIAGLEALYAAVYLRLSEPLASVAAGLDLAGKQSLATWFSSGVFAISSGLAILIFSLRRHRVDDYRGRYRVWVPVALLLLFTSLETTTGLRHLLAAWIDGQIDLAIPRRPDIWWVIVAWSLGGLLMARLLVEMRACRFACFCGVMAATSYLGSASLWGGLVELSLELCVMAEQGLLLMGHFLVFYSLLVYARYVFLHAQGQIIPRVKKRRHPSPASDSTKAADGKKSKAKLTTPPETPSRTRRTSTRTVRVDPAHTEPNSDSKPNAKATANANANSATTNSKSAAPSSRSPASSSKSSGTASIATPAADVEPARSRSVNSSTPTGQAPASGAPATQPASTEVRDDGSDDEDHAGDDRKLSKAERRKLRKETRRHQRI